MKYYDDENGFSSFGLLVAVFVTGVFIFLMIAFIDNNSSSITKSQDAQRNSDIKIIATALTQGQKVLVKNQEILPKNNTCGLAGQEIARSYVHDKGYVDLSKIINDSAFNSNIPTDPTEYSNKGTGYFVTIKDSGRITVCAPNAEFGEISFTI